MTKKKVFPKTTLPSAASSAVLVELTERGTPYETKVYFPTDKHAKDRRAFDFVPWYGKGFDQVTSACQRQIERFLRSHDGSLSPATIVTYCETGLKEFLNFLLIWRVALVGDLELVDVERKLIDAFLKYLDDRGLKTTSRKTIYYGVKPVLVALGKRGAVRIVTKGDDATFPFNPFPGAHRKAKGEAPLPKGQRRAFTAAVKTEVMAIFRDDAVLTSKLLAYALFIVALHTGRNTVPLLEMTTGCLRAHPRKNTRFLVVYKRRGNKSSVVPVKTAGKTAGETEEETSAVRPTVARVIERVIELTGELRKGVPKHLGDRLWLYPSRQGTNMGAIVSLSRDTLEAAAAKLVSLHKLTEPDGRPVRINCGRLRKTFINRINEILDDDLAATAAAAGNTPQVTGSSYLRPCEDAKKNWRFMGAVMTKELRTGALGTNEKTPVASCTDVKGGQFAPRKDGAVCMSFLDCLRCRNCVVTGDDLHKIFSLYWRVYRERDRLGRRGWEKRYAHIPRVIERDIVAAGVRKRMFTQEAAAAARELARASPHPFWSVEGLFEALQ